MFDDDDDDDDIIWTYIPTYIPTSGVGVYVGRWAIERKQRIPYKRRNQNTLCMYVCLYVCMSVCM